MDKGGFEPPASRMRSGRATVALLARYIILVGVRLKTVQARGRRPSLTRIQRRVY